MGADRRRWGRCGTDAEGRVLVRDREAGCSGGRGAAPRSLRLCTRSAEASTDPDVLPRRAGGERCRPRAVVVAGGRSCDGSSRSRKMAPCASTSRCRANDRRSSSRCEPVLRDLRPGRPGRRVSDRAWLAAMLAPNARSPAPSSRRRDHGRGCRSASQQAVEPSLYDCAALAVDGRAAGNPVEPLVRAMRARVGEQHAAFVHRGATSQDIVDSAAMLVAQRASRLIDDDLAGAADGCARLAAEHRRHGDGSAHAAAASGADDLRLQGGRLARRPRRGADAARGRRCRAAGAARRRGRDARRARGRGRRGAAAVRRGARPARADPAVAHDAERRSPSSRARSPALRV